MTDLRQSLRVPVEELVWSDSLEALVSQDTSSIEPSDEIVGQSRAVKAIQLGLAMRSHGYNIFVSGIYGTGRSTIVEKLIEGAL